MELALQGKRALVTGSSRGIGRAIALALARGGASVALNYAGNEAAAAEALKLVQEAGAPKAKLYRFDDGDPAACAPAVEAVVAELGSLDVLVNNAGIALDQLVMRLKDEDWNRTLQVNLTSVVGEMGNAGQAAYAATKAGLIGLTKSVARELASRNIRVNAVAPGFIDTDMTSGLPEAARTRMLETIPLARLGSAEEVANTVAFLASDEASYVTGEVLRVNGGMYM